MLTLFQVLKISSHSFRILCLENWGFLTRRSWPWVDGLAQHLNYTLDRPELSEPKLLKEWQKPWRVFNNVYLISELSELSELDEDTSLDSTEETDANIQTPKRKRPSDYFARKPKE